jgi:hypothetical protein
MRRVDLSHVHIVELARVKSTGWGWEVWVIPAGFRDVGCLPGARWVQPAPEWPSPKHSAPMPEIRKHVPEGLQLAVLCLRKSEKNIASTRGRYHFHPLICALLSDPLPLKNHNRRKPSQKQPQCRQRLCAIRLLVKNRFPSLVVQRCDVSVAFQPLRWLVRPKGSKRNCCCLFLNPGQRTELYDQVHMGMSRGRP